MMGTDILPFFSTSKKNISGFDLSSMTVASGFILYNEALCIPDP